MKISFLDKLNYIVTCSWIRLTRSGKKVFHEDQYFPLVKEFESYFFEIRAELARVLEKDIPSFHEVSPMQRQITSDDQWKTFVFKGYGIKDKKNCQACPKTARLINKYPEITTAMFSILKPGKQIPPHKGPFNGVLRFHLPLMVPKQKYKTGLRIKNGKGQATTLHWTEGRGIVFDDSYEHSAWNESEDVRVVLFIDFIRPIRCKLLKSMNRRAYDLMKRIFLVDSKEYLSKM